jgi:CRISPR system Cascade subunit CasC
MFLQIHTLTSYPASLLNRDDAGLAKRIPFGNATRLRISSQCLKRHWRERLQETVPLPTGIRTRHFFEREIFRRLKEENVPEIQALNLTQTLMDLLLQRSAKQEKSKKSAKAADEGQNLGNEATGAEESAFGAGDLQAAQPILFGRPEADYLVKLLKDCANAGGDAKKRLQECLKKDKQNFRAMLLQGGYGNLYAGLEGALFGRFVTSDILSRADASVHVAHSFTVHRLDTEVDYFTVVDDLNREEETGAAHAGDMELGAGLFYGYVVVDMPLLMSNLTGCDSKSWASQNSEDARRVLKGLVQAIATVSPGAKLGSTAPYSYSDFVLLECGRQQPRTLANSFLEALALHGDAMQAAADQIGRQIQSLDKMYGRTADFRAVSTNRDFPAEVAAMHPLNETVDLALKSAFGE